MNSGKIGKTLAADTSANPILTWKGKVPDTGIENFQRIIEEKYNLRFDSYWELHKWSIENYIQFWEELWHYVGVITSKPYDQVLVKTGPGFLENDWFSGSLFNYAENVLRHRDDSVALICLDEYGREETVTFAEMFDEVKLYAAAFRKNGLKKGDTVACYMSNRKEPFFAMLAATSIGAIWGGPLPYYGGRGAANLIHMMEPKFLLVVDSHMYNGNVMNLVDNLPTIVNRATTLEKVIVVVTEEATLKKDFSNIRNCVFLKDFLQEGRTPDGTVPEIEFEQLPFNHPTSINFTSGTTDLPKGPVHSAGTFVSRLRDFVFNFNIKKGDVIGTNDPVGWSNWNDLVPSLALGCTIFLYCGSFLRKINGMNFWDTFAKYNVKVAFLATSVVDQMEKMGMVPSPQADLDSLKIIAIIASPAKKENIEYIRQKVKNDLFVGSYYGATEVFGQFSIINLNMPLHGAEIQAPSLGIDIQCYDSDGKSVIGQRGELVICTPAPNFPTGLWKDADNAIMKRTYLSKYPGVWCQNDDCWINPKTKGIIVFGRSDDTLKQKSSRFGSGDIYFAINSMEELEDYICVEQKKYNGDCRVILFVKMKKGIQFTPQIKKKIEWIVKEELWQDCVPGVILEVPDIPYNLNYKRLESVVRTIVATNKIPEVVNIRNPESLEHFLNIPEIVSYNEI